MPESNNILEALTGGPASPQFANSREFAAVIESLGYNDGLAKEWGFASTFELAEHLFPQIQTGYRSAADHKNTPARAWREIQRAVRKLSLSLAYSVPWMGLLVVEYFRPRALPISPELGSALSLSLIASLITSGGFVQMISRGGGFYFEMKESVLAKRICDWISNLGFTISLVLVFVGIVLGAYFHLFAGKYLLLAAINYVSLTELWMICSVLSVRAIGWCIPLVFALSAFTLFGLKTYALWSPPLLLMSWPVLAALCASGCLALDSRRTRTCSDDTQHPGPRLAIVLIPLAPSCLHGFLYFSFLFADRLMAGSAISWTSGLSFGIDLAYKRGMDVVLLAFLITAAAVEYLGDSFLQYWRRLAAEFSHTEMAALGTLLRRRHTRHLFVVSVLFIAACIASWSLFSGTRGFSVSTLLVTATLGGLGYLMLGLALLESIILSGTNAGHRTLTPFTMGLAINLGLGYALSHLFGVQYAATGLLAGAALVFWKCNSAVTQVLLRPDYQYAIS